MPSLFLVGAPKTGTSALAAYLAEHPQVVMSRPKEPMYWCTDLPSGAHELRPSTWEDYLAMFRREDDQHGEIRHRGEASTKYLRSEVAIPSILAANPEARFVAMIRNPVEVVQAFHMEQRYQGQEPHEDFMTAWRDQDRRDAADDGSLSSGRSREELRYRHVADFPRQLRRFFDTVPADQRHVIVHDDFRADPAAVWAELLDFLGIDDDGRTEFPRVNAAHGQRFPRLSAALLHPPGPLQPAMRSVRRRFIERPNRLVTGVKSRLNVARDRPPLEPSELDELSAHFRPQIDELEVLLETDLGHWHRGVS